MTKAAAKNEVESVLPSTHGRVGKPGCAADVLVLTPQLRVANSCDVLTLMPEHAVTPLGSRFAETESTDAGQTVAGERSQAVNSDARPNQGNASALGAKIAALETAIAKTVGEWEPDDAGRDAYAGTQPPAIAWRSDVDLDARGAPLDVANMVSRAALSDVAEVAPETQALDEEALHEMVAQIIRSELRGELGERITRNVRKLVRQEIRRAFAARGLL